jgi:putative ABC transport system permease protein
MYTTTDLNRLYIKVPGGETTHSLTLIEEKWSKFYPDDEFEYNFLGEDFKNLYEAEQRTSKLSTFFAALAIFISCLGLFGLVSFATEERTKEIGIRKVMGASVGTVFFLLTTDFTKLVFLSLFIAIPIGWFAMNQWLSSFAYHIEISIWIYVLASIFAFGIALLTVSYRSIKASTNNPVVALRNE